MKTLNSFLVMIIAQFGCCRTAIFRGAGMAGVALGVTMLFFVFSMQVSIAQTAPEHQGANAKGGILLPVADIVKALVSAGAIDANATEAEQREWISNNPDKFNTFAEAVMQKAIKEAPEKMIMPSACTTHPTGKGTDIGNSAEQVPTTPATQPQINPSGDSKPNSINPN